MSDEKEDAFSIKFAEIIKKIHSEPKPELEDIWTRLGPFKNRIKVYSVELLEEDPLFWNVGKPFQVNWSVDFKVEQVASWEEAVHTRRLDKIDEAETLAVKRITALLEETDRISERDAIRDLMIHYLRHHIEKRYSEQLLWFVPSDFELALMELILRDAGKPMFFLERWAWYDAGHFPCGVKENGTRIIY